MGFKERIEKLKVRIHRGIIPEPKPQEEAVFTIPHDGTEITSKRTVVT